VSRLPDPHDAQQLCRLRQLRVQRARDICKQAQAALAPAAAAVHRRQQQIEQGRQAIDAWSRAVVNELAPQLPRWANLIVAQRDRLRERLERDEYALIDDERQLEQAQEQLQQASAALTRALAQEDAVRGLLAQARRELAAARERRAEVELEDQGPARAPG
jgi:chromosome segregation ATPase